MGSRLASTTVVAVSVAASLLGGARWIAASPQSSTPQAPAFVMAAGGRTPLEWANDMVEHVSAADTTYAHSTPRVTWAGQHGATEYASQADCSSFVEALLTQAYGVTPEQYRAWLGKRRPFAKDFYDAIESQNGFARIEQIASVRPGDLIAVRYVSSAPGDNTGHLMLVASEPSRRVATKPVVESTQQWDVVVIDSSESGHGKADTRRLATNAFRNGVGRGTLRLYSDRDGAVSGHAWSDFENSVYYDHETRPVVIGRLKTGR